MASPSAYSTLVRIAASFPNAHFNLVDRESRRLIRRGRLLRKARFGRLLKRHGFLFDDVFVFAEPRKDGQFKMKQVLVLDEVELSASSTNLHSFTLTTPQREYHVFCVSEEEKQAWLDSFRDAQDGPVRAPPRSPEAPNEHLALSPPVASPMLSSSPLSREPSTGSDTDDAAGDAEAAGPQVLGWSYYLHRSTVTALAEVADIEALRRVLDERKPDLQVIDQSGQSAIHAAIASGNTDTVELLLERGATLDQPNADGLTALHIAASTADPNMVRYLLDQKCDHSSFDAHHHTPLWHAAIARVPPEVDEQHALSDDALVGDDEHPIAQCILALVKANATLASVDAHGWPLLNVLARDNRIVAMLALLENGASVQVRDDHGRGPLHLAARFASPQMARILLFRGAQPNARDDKGETPLFAVKSAAMADLLVSFGARTEITDPAGHQPPIVKQMRREPETAAQLEHAETNFRKAEPVRGDRNLVARSDDSWVSDDSSEECLVCTTPFTFTQRRHHCRRCGNLVCSLCSSKQFLKSGEAYRACDGCYNTLRFKAAIRRRAASTRRDEPNPADRIGDLDAKLQERGRQLDEMAEKVDELEDEAADFHASTTQLRKNVRS